MSSTVSFAQNPEFMRIMRMFKKVLPMTAVAFLLFVYLINAWAEGALLSMVIGKKVLSGVILAYGISFAIQIGRMILVYYPLLNPTTPRFGYSGEITGVLLGSFAISSIWSLTFSSNMDQSFAISLTLLIIVGIMAELYLLREMKKQIKLDLISNPAYVEDIIRFHSEDKRIEQILYQIEQGNLPESESPTLAFNLPGKKRLSDSLNQFDRVSLNGVPDAEEDEDDEEYTEEEQIEDWEKSYAEAAGEMPILKN